MYTIICPDQKSRKTSGGCGEPSVYPAGAFLSPERDLRSASSYETVRQGRRNQSDTVSEGGVREMILDKKAEDMALYIMAGKEVLCNRHRSMNWNY